MIDIADLDIVIPFRCDSPARLENLAAVLGFLTSRFANPQILLIESAKTREAAHIAENFAVRYLFEESDSIFHRTRLLNKAFSRSNRPFVASYDADVLWYPPALEMALARLREGATAALASDGRFADVSGEARAKLTGTLDVESVTHDWPRRKGPILPGIACTNADSVGGAVLFNREALLAFGGYNENFISWGWEDTELAQRVARLSHPYSRVDGYPLLHLAHPRGPDSNASNPYFAHNAREYRKIRRMARVELEAYVANGGLRCDRLPRLRPIDRLSSTFRHAIFSLTRRSP